MVELKEALTYYDADMVVTNDELSPSQLRNLETGTSADIMDHYIDLRYFCFTSKNQSGEVASCDCSIKISTTSFADIDECAP